MYRIITTWTEGHGDNARAHRAYSQAFKEEETALKAIDFFFTVNTDAHITYTSPTGKTFHVTDDDGQKYAMAVRFTPALPSEEETDTLVTHHYEFITEEI